MTLSEYFKHSSHRFYGAATALVMLTLYEVFIMWEAPSGVMIRNAPEAWMRNMLNFIGISHYHISFVMLGAAIVALPLFYDRNVVIRKRIVGLLIVESVFWGILSGFLIQLVMTKLFFAVGTISGSVLGDLGLAIGAGLFEELLFRVVLTTLLIHICLKIVRVKWISIGIAIILASFLFSLAHYVGNVADSFDIYSFTFRFFAGIWFTTLYSIRGFALVCMTHAFYDIFVIFL